MENNLISPFKNDLTEEENTLIDDYINKTYEEHKDNTKALTQLAMQASSSISAGKAKSRELANQGFLKNLWGGITGKNRKVRGEIDRDFAVSVESCIRMVSKLAQENKLTFDAIMGVNVKINNLVGKIDKEFNEVYTQMGKMMQTAMSSLIRESMRVDKLEKSMNVIQLESTIEYLDFNGTLYKDLGDNEKILCIISDFFLATKGQYSINDLMMLKPMMSKVGLDPNNKISMESLYRTILDNNVIVNKLFESIEKAKIDNIVDFEIPLLGNIKKIERLETDEKYIVDTISNMTNRDEKEVLFDLLKTYANNDLNMDLSKENSSFDLSVALINELTNIDLTEVKVEEEFEEKQVNNSVLASLYEELGDSYFKLRDLESAYNNYNLAIENGLANKDIYYKLFSLIYYNVTNYFSKDILIFPHMKRDIVYNLSNDIIGWPYSVFLNSSTSQNKESKSSIVKLFVTSNISSKFLNIRNNLEEEDRQNPIFKISYMHGYNEDSYVYVSEEPPKELKTKKFEIDREKIESYIEKFLDIYENSFDATIDAGVMYEELALREESKQKKLELCEKALDFFEKAIKIDNERVEGFINKALVLDYIDSEKNRLLVEEALNRAIGLDSSLFGQFKTSNGAFIDNLSSVLVPITSFTKFLDEMGF